MPDAVLRDLALETIAQALDSTGRFMVARRLQPVGRYAEPDGTPTLTALFLDVETTGLDTERDAVFQLALLPFEYAPATGRIYGVGEAFVHLEDPGRPIPPEITALTGISDADVAGKRIDDAAVAELVANTRLVIAHNAGFDRPMAERRLPLFRDLPWACSQVEVPWPAYGITSAKLEYILFRHCRAFFQGHRADEDCFAALHALATPFPDGQLPFRQLLESSRRRTVRIWALDSPYESRHALKTRHWRWNPGEDGRPRAWSTDVREEEADQECEWLREAVYGGRSGSPWRTHVFGALDRYSVRV